MAAVTFTWWGQELELFDHPYNDTAKNERAVEIAVANEWMRGREGRGLEVGNVLAHYRPVDHRVVDRYEQASHVDNVDVFDVDGDYRWIISVSTVEHVRSDEPATRDPWAAARAIRHLRTLLAPGGEMLMTVGLGQHWLLDDYLLGGAETVRACTFIRAGDHWYQTEHPTWRPYAATTLWADAVWIGEWKG